VKRNLKAQKCVLKIRYVFVKSFEVKPNLFLGTQLKSGECLNEKQAKTMAQK